MRSSGLISTWLRNARPEHLTIAKGMAMVMLFTALGKFAGAAKEMAVAYRYGVGAEVDAYLFVFNLLIWPISIWFSVLTVVLLPLAAVIRHDHPQNLPLFRAELFGLSILLGAGFILIAWIVLPALLGQSWVGLPPATAKLAEHMAIYLTPMLLVGVLISLFSVWVMSAGHQINTLFECIPALSILVAVVWFSDGMEPLIWGTLIGVVLHLASLVLSLIRRNEIERPRFALHSTSWSMFRQGFTIVLAGQLLMSLTSIADQFFAAHLGEGAISTLGYANRILALILGLGATAVARATLPVFSSSRAQQDKEMLDGVAVRWALFMFIFGIFAMLVGWWLAPWGVRILFERGAFTPHHTSMVAEVLRCSLLQIPFYFAGIVLVSLLNSQRKYKVIAFSGAIGLLIKIVANFVLVPTMGINGIVLSSAVMYLVSMCLLYWFIRQHKGLD